MTISLIPLPYPADALEPYISRRTFDLHHGAHHKDYVDKTNKAIADTDLVALELNGIVKAAKGPPKVFNPASQAWNHGFYWNSVTPERLQPSERLSQAIDRDFGSMGALKWKLAEEAVAHFGSGWVWLIAEIDKLNVVSTHDAHSPFSDGEANPLLTIDVWEHAYYLDVQNKRADYVEALVENAWTGTSPRKTTRAAASGVIRQMQRRNPPSALLSPSNAASCESPQFFRTPCARPPSRRPDWCPARIHHYR